MLRVYSILYTERLWHANLHDVNPVKPTLTDSMYTPGLCSQETNQREVSQDAFLSENQETEDEEVFVRDQAQVEVQQDTEEEEEESESEEEVFVVYQAQVQAQQDTVEEESIIPCHPHSIFEGSETHDIEIETSLNNQPNDEENLEHITTVTEDIADIPRSIVKQELDNDDEILSIKSLSSNDEKVVESLTIDTTSSPVPIHENEVHTATSLVSSSSTASSVPPKTPPSSNHSFLQTRSKTTSLIRRETTKLNDRRKSLTKKIKRVLHTGSPTKRFSI